MAMPRRGLLCLDLDGTLLGSDHQVSRANADAVRAAAAAGWTIALCTGRGPTMYCPTGRELGVDGRLFLVGFNGAVIFEMDVDGQPTRALFESKMTSTQVCKVLDLAHGLAVELDTRDAQYARSSLGEPNDLLQKHIELVRSEPVMSSDLPEVLEGVCDPYKMTILTADPASFVARAVSIPGFTDDGIGVVVGGPFWVETVPLRTDKAAGVALVCAELGFSAESCVYIGDGANDATSLAWAGLGVAVRGSKPEALAAADRTSSWTNDEDAVAKEIHMIIGTTEFNGNC